MGETAPGGTLGDPLRSPKSQQTSKLFPSHRLESCQPFPCMPGDVAVTAPRDSSGARRQQPPERPAARLEQQQKQQEEAEGSRGTRCSSATSKGLRGRVHGKDSPAASLLAPHPSGCRHRCGAAEAPGSPPGSEQSDAVLGFKSRSDCTTHP